MVKRALRGLLTTIVELIILLPCSMLVGFVIGTLQHYVAFGVRGTGFELHALRFAAAEGGTVGYLFAVPTGLLTYYGALSRRLDTRLAVQVVSGSLIAGCVLGLLFDVISAALTPLFTIGLAFMLQLYREQKTSDPVR